MEITEPMIESAYKVARQFYEADGKIRITEAKDNLAAVGFNRNSAVDMIYNLKHLMNGALYKRNLSERATDAYLRWIQRDYGNVKLRNTVSALQQHIDYYQALTGTPMSAQVAIFAKYERIPGVTNDFLTSPEEVELPDSLKEGRTRAVLVNIYERNPKARMQCIEFYGLKCHVCGFDFEEKYGAIGKNFVHVHHLRELASVENEYVVDPIKDLRPVCPNCHAMLHKQKPAYTIAKLKALLK